MFLFCPVCNNLLEIGEDEGRYIFVCVVCPYKCKIRGAYRFPFYTKLKEADEVLHEADAWKNAQTTTINCPSCDHPKAYYQELQTRSADEPATIFYRCCECSRTWKSD